MDIIPSIDIIEGKCVRLEKGDFKIKKVYSSDPVEVAKTFESWGITRLHLVDLDGAKAKRIINNQILEKIATQTNLIIDYGGGLRTMSDIRIAFASGASMVTGGSIAVKDPEGFLHWIDEFGSDKIILGADHRNEIVSVNAWNENSKIELFPFLETFINRGISKVICTDIERDGMLNGPSFKVYEKILQRWPHLYLVASGGLSSAWDLDQLNQKGIPAVIIGKAIYENKITSKDLEPYLIISE